MTLEAASGHRSQTWATPQRWVDAAAAALALDGFALDAACVESTAKAPRFYTPAEDGLAQPWADVTWCNPPWDAIPAWVRKAIAEYQRSRVRSVLLLPSRPGMGWFQRVRGLEANKFATVAFPKGRIAYEGAGSAPYEYSVFIGIGRGLEGLAALETHDDAQLDLFGGADG